MDRRSKVAQVEIPLEEGLGSHSMVLRCHLWPVRGGGQIDLHSLSPSIFHLGQSLPDELTYR